MKITYNFLNGETIEVETNEEIGQAILQIQKEIKNNDILETRSHQSLSELQDNSKLLEDKSANIENAFLKITDEDKLYLAISKLKPKEQELIHKIYLSKHPVSQVEYARNLNISNMAMWKKAQRIRNKLKKLIYCSRPT